MSKTETRLKISSFYFSSISDWSQFLCSERFGTWSSPIVWSNTERNAGSADLRVCLECLLSFGPDEWRVEDLLKYPHRKKRWTSLHSNGSEVLVVRSSSIRSCFLFRSMVSVVFLLLIKLSNCFSNTNIVIHLLFRCTVRSFRWLSSLLLVRSLFDSVSILSGARNAKNTILAEQLFDRMERNFPNDDAALIAARVLLANTFALHGDKKRASATRMDLKQSTTRKVAGLTWTVINGQIFVMKRETSPARVTSDCFFRNFEPTIEAILSGMKSSKSFNDSITNWINAVTFTMRHGLRGNYKITKLPKASYVVTVNASP